MILSFFYTFSQILYSEQIREYPRLRDISLRCQLFGQAGYYTLYLTSGMHATGSVIATIPVDGLLKVSYSFFNSYMSSIYFSLVFCDCQEDEKVVRKLDVLD